MQKTGTSNLNAMSKSKTLLGSMKKSKHEDA
jgi:hypothetical protein